MTFLGHTTSELECRHPLLPSKEKGSSEQGCPHRAGRSPGKAGLGYIMDVAWATSCNSGPALRRTFKDGRCGWTRPPVPIFLPRPAGFSALTFVHQRAAIQLTLTSHSSRNLNQGGNWSSLSLYSHGRLHPGSPQSWAV